MTYSIIARDPDSGHMGVATQSQAFAVGSSVSWALPGHGVIATQSMGEPMYGELGLDVLRSGLTAEEALTALRSVDPHPERRQVGMVDGRGRSAVYTGEACVTAAGHARGDGCIALANMMAEDGVWDAMIAAYEDAAGSWFPSRLVAALEAAEEHGGDVRGRRSAAIEVVRAEASGRPWHDRLVDLRVDDDPEPVERLAGMVAYSARYHQVVEAFELALDGDAQTALRHLDGIDIDLETEPELALWQAVVLARAGRTSDAHTIGSRLREVAPALTAAGQRFGEAALVDTALMATILDGE